MFGVEETARLPGSAYGAEITREVYRRIDDKARRALAAGHAVVLDAVFSTGAERLAAVRVAAEVGIAFDGLYLEAPLETRCPIAARRADASDADTSVARGQRAEPLRERGWSPLEASGELDRTIASAARRLGLERDCAGE